MSHLHPIPDAFTPVTCPMPDCDEGLYLGYFTAEALTVGSLTESRTTCPAAADAESTTWRVECAAGHVVLLPGPTGCPCDDQGGPDCPHPNPSDSFDWSEDFRIFRRSDAERLTDLIARIGHGRERARGSGDER